MTLAEKLQVAHLVLLVLLLARTFWPGRDRDQDLKIAALDARLSLLANALADVHGAVVPRPAARVDVPVVKPPPLPVPLRAPTPVTLDLTGPEKPTLLMPKATMDEAVRRATPTPRSTKL